MVTAAWKLLTLRKMRLLAAFSFCAALSFGQALPPGLVRGTVERPAGEDSGFELRNTAGVVYAFRFDARTWIERDGQRIAGRGLRAGETVEVVSDRENAAVRYARTIHAVTQRSAPTAHPRVRHNADTPPPVTFSGSVVRLDDGWMAVRIREAGLRQLRLRDDTRYLMNGESVGRGRLTPNTRVWVQAGINAKDELEADSIVWGDILIVQ